MIIDKNREGAWRITDIVNGYLETRVYYFYTKKEALKKFKEEFKNRRLNNG
jgi:hypothetical protein